MLAFFITLLKIARTRSEARHLESRAPDVKPSTIVAASSTRRRRARASRVQVFVEAGERETNYCCTQAGEGGAPAYSCSLAYFNGDGEGGSCSTSTGQDASSFLVDRSGAG